MTSPAAGLSLEPAAVAATIEEAVAGGTVSIDNRLRLGWADQTGLDSSTAFTNRLRLGFGTKPIDGFSGYVEFENLVTPGEDEYFVPFANTGTPTRTVIADPPATELNRAFGRYTRDGLFGEGSSLEVIAGRQRLKLDDDRFIGNVGWRQLEQTFDALTVRSDFGIEGLSALYSYVFGVQRIFGPDGVNPDSRSHLINVSYEASDALTVVPFAYLLDFEDDLQAFSSNTYGVRAKGALFRNPDDEADVFLDYEVTGAVQEDAGINPVDYTAVFAASQIGLRQKGFGGVFVGQQFLGSDDGRQAFQFPLGTNHKFQGFADNFLVTPAAGLNDVYAGISGELPGGVKATVAYHRFWTDQGGTNLGGEFDAVATKRFDKHWSVLAKLGVYDGANGQPNIARFTVQTTFRY